MNFALQTGNITAVIVFGYLIISHWIDYQGLKEEVEVPSTKHWLFAPRVAPTVHSSRIQ